jgi:hypothetical protein
VLPGTCQQGRGFNAGHHYQFDVTGGTAGTGTLEMGYGHDELADEHTFDPEAVTVTVP